MTTVNIFVANQLRQRVNRLGVQILFIEPGNPWKNGYIESFNGKMCDKLPDREIFFTLDEANTLVVPWKEEYNQVRPHSSLGYRPLRPRHGCLHLTWLEYQV